MFRNLASGAAIVCVAAVCALLLSLYAASLGALEQEKGETPEITALPAVRYSLPAGKETPVDLKTMPYAECLIYKEGEAKPAQKGLRINADSQGLIRLYPRARAGTKATVKLIVDCKVEGKITRYPLELRADTPTAEAPAPKLTARKLPRGAKELPALAAEDAANLTDLELVRRGYPIRPDAKRSPKAHAKWKKLVSSPLSYVMLPKRSQPGNLQTHGIKFDLKRKLTAPLVGSKLVPILPGFNISPSYLFMNNWSGMVQQSGVDQYVSVSGSWQVPSNSPDPGSSDSRQSILFLVGLDGLNTSGDDRLAQNGTGYDSMTGDIAVGNYFAWSELWRKENIQPHGDITINPGDTVTATTLVGNGETPATFTTGLPATSALFQFTVNNTVFVEGPRDLAGCVAGIAGCVATPKFTGNNAQWIVGRPGPTLHTLPQFPLFVMSPCTATNSKGKQYFVCGNTNEPITSYAVVMTADGNPVSATNLPLSAFSNSVPVLGDADSMALSWHGTLP